MTDNFTFKELTNSEEHPELVEANRESAKGFIKQLRYTAGTLEEIRDVVKVRLKVSSGFRNNALNKAVGGSSTSGHTRGLCADIKPLDGMSVEEAFKLIQANRDKCPSLKKCIYENIGSRKWLHIETKTEASQPQQFFTTSNGKTYTEIKA